MKKLVPEFTKEEQEYIEDIRSKIDFENSIAIHYPASSGRKSVYIVEFKTEDRNHKAFFAFNVIDVDFVLFKNFYVAAIYTRDILNKIPIWEREVSEYDLTQLDQYRYAARADELFDDIYCAKQCQQMACPETGSFTAYKKVIGNDGIQYVCELLIPKDANRLSGFERKCRTNEAKVVALWKLDHMDKDGSMHFIKTRKRVGHSLYHNSFIYRVGKTVRPDNGFNTDRFNTCAPGIHFFMTMMEAYTYRF